MTVLITGASAGIGAACAARFAKRGARLLLCARNADRLHAFSAELASHYAIEIHSFALDVADAEAVGRAIAELPASWQDVDVLVNNAGKALGKDALHEADLADLDGMIDTNVKGLVYVTRAVVPGMVARGSGHVIQIGSTAAQFVYPGGAVYCATKAAVAALTDALKMDLHGKGIRVTSIDPGLVETEFSLVRFHGDRSAADAVYDGMTPLTADDIADTVVFAATRPAHVNINRIVMMPTDQSSSALVHRRPS